MILGIAFGVWKTRGFREPLSFEVPPNDAFASEAPIAP